MDAVEGILFPILMVVVWVLIFVGLVRLGTQIAYKTIQQEKAKEKPKKK